MGVGRLLFISDWKTKETGKIKSRQKRKSWGEYPPLTPSSFSSLREVDEMLQESSHGQIRNQRWEQKLKLKVCKKSEKLFQHCTLRSRRYPSAWSTEFWSIEVWPQKFCLFHLRSLTSLLFAFTRPEAGTLTLLVTGLMSRFWPFDPSCNQDHVWPRIALTYSNPGETQLTRTDEWRIRNPSLWFSQKKLISPKYWSCVLRKSENVWEHLFSVI